ncbi:RpiR family transcriptional regulator, partial [Lactobacillus taiwanensis]
MKLDIFSNQIDFTTSEKVVILYLENHLNEIDGLTITDLAKKSLTSNATII